MEAMPPLPAFVERYDAGAPQVVFTRLVADLETPVSAYLKLAADKPMSFLLESVEGGAARGRYSVIGLEPDLVWRADGDQAFINRNPVAKPDAFTREPQPTLAALRALLAEFADRAARRVAADGGRHLRLHGLRHRAPDGAAARHAARRLAHPRRHPHAPDGDGDLRHHQGRDHHRLAGAARCEGAGGKSLQGGVQAPQRCRRRAQRAAAALAGRHVAQNRRPEADVQHDTRRIQSDGAAGEGVHCRRRHLPGGGLAALLGAVRPLVILSLPRPAPHQSLAVPLPPRLRRLRPCRLQPRDPGARARRRGDHPPHRRHGPAGRHRRRGSGAGGSAAEGSQGARRAPDARSTSAATTSAASPRSAPST